MVEGGMKCVKYVLFLFNLLFFLAGLGLIIAGALVQTKLSVYFDFFGGSVTALAVLLIVVGSIIFIIGFFGCCGAYKENYCMTMTFAFLLGIIFILEIAAGIAAYVMRDQFAVLLLIIFLLEIAGGVAAYILRNKVGELISEKMNDSMDQYMQPSQESITSTWNAVQMDMDCCGVNNSSDWRDTVYGIIPDSCCITEIEGSDCTDEPNNIYTDGCLDTFVNMVEENILIIGGVGIGLAFVQIVGIVLACCLARTIKKEYQVV